ncbi:MAG TPA: hypothetical protein PKC30_06320 [Saprospiraceae bacterium]|nr:hypothetical protein [Saprospiraceae bacterium]
MARILLISKTSPDIPEHKGVWLKTLHQKAALESLGHQVWLLYFCQTGFFLNDIRIKVKSLPFAFLIPSFIVHHIQFCHSIFLINRLHVFDMIYARYFFSSPFTWKLWKEIKRANTDVKMILEFPTYPYALEVSGIHSSVLMRLERWFCHRSVTFFDLLVVIAGKAFTDTMPYICLDNGIEVGSYEVKSSSIKKGSMRMIACGSLWRWYGLDRLIKGMHFAYTGNASGSLQVTLDIVGSGAEYSVLRSLVTHHGLEAFIRFHGPQSDAELNELFNRADVAIGSLAAYRKNLSKVSALKHREFSARGIPFIYADYDASFEHSFYALKVAASEDPIDIHAVVLWWEHLILEYEENLPVKIRKEASLLLSWKEQMKRVLEVVQ